MTELECLAVIRAIGHFAVHLVGRPFTIVTDHQVIKSCHSVEIDKFTQKSDQESSDKHVSLEKIEGPDCS